MKSETAKCLDCHIIGGKSPGEDVDPATLAPDLFYSADRLRPEWLIRWMREPQSLQPGTKMPTPAWGDQMNEWVPLPAEEQIQAIVDLLYNLKEQTAKGK